MNDAYDNAPKWASYTTPTSLNEAKARAAGQELTRLNVNALRDARIAAGDAYSDDAELADAALVGFDAAVNALCDAIENANPTFDRAVLWNAVLGVQA